MPIWELARRTWEEIATVDASRAVAILPVGAIEAHGPHLPLGTDGVIASGMARAAAERLEEAGAHVLLLPVLPYSAAPFAAAFPGTLSVTPEVITRLVVEIGGSLSDQGVPTMAIANAHLDPTHLASLHRAAREIDRDGRLRVAFPDLTRRPWASRLGEEFRSGACHAGRFETGVVMAEAPELVREAVRRDLPPVPASLSGAIRAGKRTFREAGGERAYFGWPADATPAEGRAMVETLGALLCEAVVAESDPTRDRG